MDHERVNITSSQMSCGVMELSRINEDTEGVLYAIASRLYHPSRGNPCGAFVFSDLATENETAADKLRFSVRTQKFGSCTMSSAFENPKTGNVILIYTWLIDHEPFKKWYGEQRVKKIGKVGT